MTADLDLILETAREAGEIAHSYFRKDPDAWDKGGNAGPVSRADIETDTYLRQNLLSARPDYGWLSEETEDDESRLGHETIFIVDPIDGTRSFLEGSKTWAVSVAIARKGKPVAGVIHMPAKGLTYSASLGKGAFLNGTRLFSSSYETMEQSRVLAARPALQSQHWRNAPPRFDRHFRPSLAYRLALVAEGRFDAMLTIRPTWEWDVAAGMLIAEEAGAIATDQNGRSGQFNSAKSQLDGVLVATSGLHEALGRELKYFERLTG